MELIGQLAAGLATSPLSWILALSLVVIGYLYRARENAQKEFLDMVMKQEGSHRETLMKVLPIAEKLGDSVESLERITASILKDRA